MHRCLPFAAVVAALFVAATAGTASAELGHVHGAFCGHATTANGDDGGVAGFNLSTRWSRTAIDGSGLGQGDATTITWGFVDDGTSWTVDGGSNLVAFMDNILGAGPGGSDYTQRPWFDEFESSFARWGELSGITYVYEASDDGAAAGAIGVAGVRADVRIGGDVIDGPGSVLAFNSFPNNGDMTLDTGDVNFYSNPGANFRPLRNVIQHEHGHGLGFAHVESNDARFLMEPFIQTQFDGVQYDEIRGLHRGYGDALEKNGGNDTIATAFDLGNATIDALGIGNDGDTGTIVAPTETDFVSIDGTSDTDIYSFTVDGLSTLDLILTPEGPTYSQGPQGGTQSTFDAQIVSDLSITLIDSDGVTTLVSLDEAGNGESEILEDFLLAEAGTYFLEIDGDFDNVQLYSLNLSAVLVPEPGFVMGGLAAVGLLLRRRSA